MLIRYFVADQSNTLWRVPAEDVERLWRGESTIRELKLTIGSELRIVTVLCDDRLLPRICFFARLELEDGAIDYQSRVDVYEAVGNRYARRYDHPAAKRQFAGWPSDWQRQLAVALDIPAKQLQRIGVGGPLVMADLWGISMDKVLEYFEEVDDTQP